MFNSFVASLIVALLLSGPAIYVYRKTAKATVRNRWLIATGVSLLGFVLLLALTLPDIRAKYQEQRAKNAERQAVLSNVSGERDEVWRLHFSCAGECDTDLVVALEACLHSEAQSRVYGPLPNSRGDALGAVIRCMHDLGYAVSSCHREDSPCLIVPEVGVVRRGYRVHRYRFFAYDCDTTPVGDISCEMTSRARRLN